MPTAPTDASLAALAVAASHQADTNATRAAQMAAIIAAWRQLDPAHPIKSWIDGVGERVYVLLSTGQEAVAAQAGDYVRTVLDAQDILADVPEINAVNFAGIASDGRNLETLLAGAAIRTSLAQRQGKSPAQAMQAGEAWLRMVVDTQINDAGRAADSVAIATVDAFEKTAQEVADDAADRASTALEGRAQRALAGPAVPAPGRTSVPLQGNTASRAALLERLKTARQGGPATRTTARTGLSSDRQAQVDAIKQQTLDRIARQRAERDAARRRPADRINRGAVSRRQVTVGYVRLLTPPSCSRCVVLAGRFYKWSAGFERHPMCDCKHIPATQEVGEPLLADPDAYFNSLSIDQQNYYFGKANAEAIRSGADLSRVVNAQDGMYTADDGRRYTKTASKTRRGNRGKAPVLRPTVWQIYKDSRGDRERAKRALEFNGYIVPQRSQS